MRIYFKEFFGHSSTLGLVLLAAICLFVAAPEIGSWVFWVSVVVGALVFFASEYTTHRFLFHLPAPKNERMLKLMKRLHYDHHEVPNDLDKLFLPLWYSVPNMVVVAALVWLITGSWTITFAVVLGAVLALLHYEWVHFVAHRPIKPRTAWGRFTKKIHLWHHYKNENYWFGVTNPSMDFVMKTWRDEKETELSPTARKLLG